MSETEPFQTKPNSHRRWIVQLTFQYDEYCYAEKRIYVDDFDALEQRIKEVEPVDHRLVSVVSKPNYPEEWRWLGKFTFRNAVGEKVHEILVNDLSEEFIAEAHKNKELVSVALVPHPDGVKRQPIEDEWPL